MSTQYLDLEFEVSRLDSFTNVQLRGEMGDKEGYAKYSEINAQPLDKWKTVVANPFRKAWCRRYLRWIGKERLAIMGYDLDELLGELDVIPTSLRSVPADMKEFALGTMICALQPRIITKNFEKLKTWHGVNPYY